MYILPACWHLALLGCYTAYSHRYECGTPAVRPAYTILLRVQYSYCTVVATTRWGHPSDAIVRSLALCSPSSPSITLHHRSPYCTASLRYRTPAAASAISSSLQPGRIQPARAGHSRIIQAGDLQDVCRTIQPADGSISMVFMVTSAWFALLYCSR